MRKKIIMISILIIIFVFILIFVLGFINSKGFYKDAIDNIKDNYNIVLNLDSDLSDEFKKDEGVILGGNLKTEHTSNLVHSINQVYEKNYSFLLKENDGVISIYLDDKVSKFEIDKYYNMFEISDIDKCKYMDETDEMIVLDGKESKVSKYNYLCDSYKLSVYTSKLFNKYIKSEIIYDGVIIEFYKDSVNYNSNLVTLNYSNIKKDNYVLNLKFIDKEFKIFYTYNDYSKYSFMYGLTKFNVVMDDSIILSMNCDTRKYSKLKLTLTNDEVRVKDSYQEIEIDEMLELILSSEIYSLFK